MTLAAEPFDIILFVAWLGPRVRQWAFFFLIHFLFHNRAMESRLIMLYYKL